MTSIDGGRLSAAVVGAGFVGQIHARALQDHPRVDLLAVGGRSSDRAERLAGRYGIRSYLSTEQLLKEQQPGLVCICTGNKDHAEPALESLAAGAHVFVEKPLAFTLEEGRAMVEAARRAGCSLGVNFNHRFSEPYRRALEFVSQGGLGAVCYAHMKFAGSLYRELNDPYCQLIETQGHSFDLLRLFGGEIEELAAFLADPRDIGVYTSAAISFRFRNGGVGSLLGSWDSSYHHPSAQVLEVSGTEGRVVVDNVVDSVRLFQNDRAEYVEWRPKIFDTPRRDFWATIDVHLDAFVDALLSEDDVPVDGEDGLKALEATYACIESFESGRAVTLASR